MCVQLLVNDEYYFKVLDVKDRNGMKRIHML